MPSKGFKIFGEKVTITNLKTGKIWTFVGPPNGIGLTAVQKGRHCPHGIVINYEVYFHSALFSLYAH